MNYYNEIDKRTAQWLRNLIEAGLLPQGDVDERSITDVEPNDLAGYTQCHFFAGIGGWSEALRLAGWPQDVPVWTGSAPCQSFSRMGKGLGKSDKRHLWPEFFRLIKAVKPSVIFGEQVDEAVKHGWLDDVFDDLEAADYETGAHILPACSIGAPFIGQRIYFVASTDEKRLRGIAGKLAQAPGEKHQEIRQTLRDVAGGSGALGGFWANAEWIVCSDGLKRPVEPGAHPLAYGIPKGMGKFCTGAYANAIVPEMAAEFVSVFMEYMCERRV